MDGVETRTDGSIRRPGKDGRTRHDFFAPEKLAQPMTRADYLNVRSSEEFARRHTRWYWRIFHWLFHRAQVRDINVAMAQAHGRSIRNLERALLEQQDKAKVDTKTGG